MISAMRIIGKYAAVALVAVVVTVLLYAFLGNEPLYLLPPWANRLEPKDLIQAQNSARATLVQTLGGAVLLIGLILTWRTMRATLLNIELTQDKQITERFTKAVEQLGHENVTVRIGGIFALGRIARESKTDHWPIMEILTAYLRNRSSETKRAANSPTGSDAASCAHCPCYELNAHQMIPETNADFAAIVEVLRCRKASYESSDQRLNLERVNLEGVNFSGADLRGARLFGASLQGARFYRAHLEGADFSGAILRGTDFTEAYLDGVNLIGTDLHRAVLVGTDLERAMMYSANLLGANLTDSRGLGDHQRTS
jgi:Pentapeptide repeats (8 copies)